MTLDQVNALMTPALKLAGTMNPATRIEISAKGNWIVQYKAANVPAGQTAPYKVFLFSPSKTMPNNFYAIFFSNDTVLGKSFFDLQGGAVLEQNLGLK